MEQLLDGIPIKHFFTILIIHFFNIQGDSKRLLKVHVSITSKLYGVGDLKYTKLGMGGSVIDI